jgi:hypothetical protein
MTITTVHFAHIAALYAAEKAALIAAMTPAERAAYARYLDAVAFDYIDDVPADYVAPTAASVLADAQAVLASQEAATATEKEVTGFPMLMDIAAEVTIATAEMEADGFTWSEGAQTWVRATEAAIEAAEFFDADYDAWLDSLPADQPTPEELAVEAA